MYGEICDCQTAPPDVFVCAIICTHFCLCDSIGGRYLPARLHDCINCEINCCDVCGCGYHCVDTVIIIYISIDIKMGMLGAFA